jgi:hypothetical protein
MSQLGTTLDFTVAVSKLEKREPVNMGGHVSHLYASDEAGTGHPLTSIQNAG